MVNVPLLTGDILFFSGNALSDKIVQRATNGPYNHVAVVVRGQLVEALSHGIVTSPLREATAIARVGKRLEDIPLQRAITLVQHMVGLKYGVWDIIADGIKVVLPKKVTGVPFLVAPSQFNCSAMATLFLTVAGLDLPDEFYLDPHHVSPNDMARYLQLETKLWPTRR